MHQPVSLAEEPQIEQIDRITVKDGSKIHLIKTDELIYTKHVRLRYADYSFGGISEGTDDEVF